jgi:RHS repeat-associated protein
MATTANTATGGKGRVSSLSVANRKGYAGYEFDEAASVYHVRHRVYLPESGRWSRRDPLGYVDGLNLLQYVNSSPQVYLDPSGRVLAGCAFGGLIGAAGGALGGLIGDFVNDQTGQTGRAVGCGAIGGAVTGCCIGALANVTGPIAIAGACLCGAIGSLVTTACNNNGFSGWNACDTFAALAGASAGCVSGFVGDIAPVHDFVIGVIQGIVGTWCQPPLPPAGGGGPRTAPAPAPGGGGGGSAPPRRTLPVPSPQPGDGEICLGISC